MQDSSIWIEKFRPRKFEEVIGQETIVRRIKAFVDNKNLPHLLLAGPPGVGKSTIALVIARELYGDNWRENFLELNASDTRGIDTIRNQVKDFCRTKALGETPFKIIFLDESDSLTGEAQNSMRRIMEQYAHNTRFILSCVTPDTKVILKDEIEVNIGDIKDMIKPVMICANTKSMSLDKSLSLIYSESSVSKLNKKVIKIKTDTGRILKVTTDHLIFTKEGWKHAGDLSQEDSIAVLPVLEGTSIPKNGKILVKRQIEDEIHHFEKKVLNRKNIGEARYYLYLSSKEMKKIKGEVLNFYNKGLSVSKISRDIRDKYNIKLSITQISRLIKNNTKIWSEKVCYDLKQKGLIPLTTSNPNIGTICRLIGYLFGDGHISINRRRVTFVGDYYALLLIKKELEEIGFKASNIANTKKRVIIKGKKTKGVSSMFHSYSKSLWILMRSLGVPIGNKCKTSYSIPKWIMEGPRFIRREFLRGFFDAEMSTPVLEKKSPTRFIQLDVTQHKIESNKDSCFEFLGQCQELLSEFGIISYIKSKKMHYVRKDGYQTIRFQLKISATNQNVLNFFKKVGFYYEFKKKRLGRLIQEYLRYKHNFLKNLKEISNNAIGEYNEGKSSKISIANKYGISVSLLTNQLENKEITLPYTKFPHFPDWVKEHQINKNSEFVWNKIENIENCMNENIVCDLSVDKFHNFVGNGFLIHNCNYSSKIIDPIQSRCTVFRFKPLDKEGINEIIDAICKQEKLKVDEKAREALAYVSNGDVRRLENVMQSCSMINNKITEELVYEIVSAARPKEIKELLELAVEGKFSIAKEKLLDVMLKHGLSGLDIIKQIQQEIWNLKIPDERKIDLVDKCGEIEFRMVEGSDEFVQLESLIASFMKK